MKKNNSWKTKYLNDLQNMARSFSDILQEKHGEQEGKKRIFMMAMAGDPLGDLPQMIRIIDGKDKPNNHPEYKHILKEHELV